VAVAAAVAVAADVVVAEARAVILPTLATPGVAVASLGEGVVAPAAVVILVEVAGLQP
jgi:hypothetical protein